VDQEERPVTGPAEVGIVTESCDCGTPWSEHVDNPDPFLPPSAEVFVPVPRAPGIEDTDAWAHDEGTVSP